MFIKTNTTTQFVFLIKPYDFLRKRESKKYDISIAWSDQFFHLLILMINKTVFTLSYKIERNVIVDIFGNWHKKIIASRKDQIKVYSSTV